ncbi:Rieske (2Fe-2S) protein [Streptomyces sp. C10-9-1]|uniref:Rieske (2Fe-2S) protein n=1 Tax=Streptomyces sp. C10-9-1 TaxID=1859285 RepID=UPI003D707AC6
MGAQRRAVLAAGAAAAVSLAVGCGDGDGGTPEPTGSPTGAPASPTPSDVASGSAPASPAGEELTATSEVPVGGGVVLADQEVVVTQPEEGEFRAFSAICTHQGCTVASVSDGLIACPCHGSRFRVEDGSVAVGPATRPLPPKQIAVSGDSVRLV